MTFLNGVAESLTGWSQAEAVGRPLPEIFRIVNEETRRAGREPRAAGLAGATHRRAGKSTLLIARDGTERPIDDSAAPMRDGSNAPVGAVLVFRDVTERKKAEIERERLLREVNAGRERLAEVFHRSPSFMAILRGPDHVFELANDRYNQLVGHREILGKPVRQALPEIEGQGFFELLDRVYRTGEAFAATDMRVMFRREPGRPLEERFLEFVYQPLWNPDGSISGILAQGIDLTDRKRAEAAVRQRDERLQLFLENATDYAIIMTDPEGRVLEWKGGAEQITGWREDEMLGKSADVIFTVEDRAAGAPEGEMRKAAEEGRAEDKRWHQRKDGSRFFADGVMTRLQDAGGQSQGFGKVLRDVTERKRAEEALSRNALLLANVRDSVIVTDLEGIVTYWNEGATRLFGWAAADMLGRPYADRFPEPTRSEIAESIRHYAAGADWSGEFEDFRKDGSRVWIDARISRVNDSTGRPIGVLGLAHDITDRKRAEEALKEADRRKDEFLAILAHELRNPLAPLRNGLQVMRLASADAVAVAQARDMMERQLSHMVRLIDDLLDISRISRNKMELRRQRVAVSEIVSNSIETARPLIEAAEHRLTVSLPPEPVFIDGDLTRLAQVVSNLLTNSAKYTRRGGQIWLTAERTPEEVVITVRDTGIGIPSFELPRVFGMFSQIDRSIERATGGLGIGLALVKALVEMHGGTVTAESEGMGHGSKFTVRLPSIATAAPAGLREAAKQGRAARSSGGSWWSTTTRIRRDRWPGS